MSLRLGGDGAITGCSSLSEPALTLSGLTVSSDSGTAGATVTAAGNAFLVLDSSVGGTAGNQISFIDFKNNGNNQANFAVNEGVTGKPLEINSSTNNNVTIATGGGNVGIKTSSPSADLDVLSTSGRFLVKSDQSDLCLDSVNTANNAFDDLRLRANTIHFQNGGTERMVIDSAGRVGIGVLTPSSYDSTADNLVVGESGDIGITIASSNSSRGTLMFADGTSGLAQYAGYLQYNHNGDYLAIATNNSEAMRINSNGNVGISTNNPSQKLEVAGNVKVVGGGNLLMQTGARVQFGTSDAASVIGADGSNGYLAFAANNEHMRILSNGNVGIGESAPGNKLVVRGNPLFGPTNTTDQFQGLSFVHGKDSSAAVAIGFIDFRNNLNVADTHIFADHNTDGSSHLYFGTTAAGARNSDRRSEKMRITGTGSVGIGTSNPDYIFDVEGGPSSAQFSSTANWNFSNVYIRRKASNIGIAKMISMMLDGDSASSTNLTSSLNIWGTFSGTPTTSSTSSALNAAMNLGAPEAILFHTNGSERARILPNGRVCINRTTSQSGGQLSIDYTNGVTAGLAIKDTLATGTGVVLHVVNGSGSIIGGISQNQSSTSFNTSSDYRLKENIVDLDGAIDRVKQLLPKRFNFINDADITVDGFLAHEAQSVVPEAVTGTHDEVDDEGNAVMQGIDQAKLVPLLTAALKEAIAEIETLKTKVAALEASA